MVTKKGGKGKSKKGGAKQSAAKNNALVQLPSVIPKAERGFIPGFGCMVTMAWSDAYFKHHSALMVEIARANMQRYFDKVTDAQSKASLLHILGYSLIGTYGQEATKEGTKYNMEAVELIRSLGERSPHDIVEGVWPENCLNGLMRLSREVQLQVMEKVPEWISLTRRTIDSTLERVAAGDHDAMRWLLFLSQNHFKTELEAITHLSSCFSSVSVCEEDTERWLAVFEKRVKEIEIAVEEKVWYLGDHLKQAKGKLLKSKCDLFVKQGKLELALNLIRKALEVDEEDLKVNLDLRRLYNDLCLKTGRIEEAFKSMEKVFSVYRSGGDKPLAVGQFRYLLNLVPKNSHSQSLFRELIPKYPHLLWAASSAGFLELSKDENKALRGQLEAKKGLLCVNCSKELAKIYRCSRCNLATYCVNLPPSLFLFSLLANLFVLFPRLLLTGAPAIRRYFASRTSINFGQLFAAIDTI
jgi:tetratricopeptide (TPR) repeat protein